MWKYINIILVIAVVRNRKCNAIEVCGLQDLQYCDPKDTSCMLEKAEPKARRWLIQGQKEYLVDPIESYVIESLPLTVNNKIYKLEKVKFTGFENLKLTDWKMDIENLVLTYDYDFNLDIYIDKIIDDNGRSLIGNNTLVVHLVNTHTSSKVPTSILKRCDGTSYFSFTNPSTKVSDITKDQVTSEPELQEDILEELAKTVTFNANRIISKGWKQFCSSVPIKNYWKLDI